MSLVFLIAAIVVFLLAAFGIAAIGPVATVPLGLALFAASFLPLGTITVNRQG